MISTDRGVPTSYYKVSDYVAPYLLARKTVTPTVPSVVESVASSSDTHAKDTTMSATENNLTVGEPDSAFVDNLNAPDLRHQKR